MVQAFHLGNSLVRHIPAQLAHMHGKAFAYSEGCLPASQDVLHARRSTSDI